MASERSEFIKRQAAARMASCNTDRDDVREDCIREAGYDADALNLTDSPAPAGGETEAVLKAADAWFDGRCGSPPVTDTLIALYDAIAAGRRRGAGK